MWGHTALRDASLNAASDRQASNPSRALEGPGVERDGVAEGKRGSQGIQAKTRTEGEDNGFDSSPHLRAVEENGQRGMFRCQLNGTQEGLGRARLRFTCSQRLTQSPILVGPAWTVRPSSRSKALLKTPERVRTGIGLVPEGILSWSLLPGCPVVSVTAAGGVLVWGQWEGVCRAELGGEGAKRPGAEVGLAVARSRGSPVCPGKRAGAICEWTEKPTS